MLSNNRPHQHSGGVIQCGLRIAISQQQRWRGDVLPTEVRVKSRCANSVLKYYQHHVAVFEVYDTTATYWEYLEHDIG